MLCKKELEMLIRLEGEVISNNVDVYIDGLRMDVVLLDRTRIITEQSDLRIVIIYKDFLIFMYTKSLTIYTTLAGQHSK